MSSISHIHKFCAEVNIDHRSSYNDLGLICKELANLLAKNVPLVTKKEVQEFHTRYYTHCYVLTDEGLQKLITEIHRRVAVRAPVDSSVLGELNHER